MEAPRTAKVDVVVHHKVVELSKKVTKQLHDTGSARACTLQVSLLESQTSTEEGIYSTIHLRKSCISTDKNYNVDRTSVSAIYLHLHAPTDRKGVFIAGIKSNAGGVGCQCFGAVGHNIWSAIAPLRNASRGQQGTCPPVSLVSLRSVSVQSPRLTEAEWPGVSISIMTLTPRCWAYCTTPCTSAGLQTR